MSAFWPFLIPPCGLGIAKCTLCNRRASLKDVKPVLLTRASGFSSLQRNQRQATFLKAFLKAFLTSLVSPSCYISSNCCSAICTMQYIPSRSSLGTRDPAGVAVQHARCRPRILVPVCGQLQHGNGLRLKAPSAHKRGEGTYGATIASGLVRRRFTISRLSAPR
jgi:hypothetical protein